MMINYSKKILSILIVVLICLSTVVVSSLTASGEDSRTLAFRFKDSDYRKKMVNKNPTYVRCANNGSMTMRSDKVVEQYQMIFEVTGANVDNLADAIDETCRFYDGSLSMEVRVNSAVNIKGTSCSPEIEVNLLGAGKNGEIDYNNIIARAGGGKQVPERTDFYSFDVSQYMSKEYNNDIKYVYVKVQCYDWGCMENGIKGTKPDVIFYPIYVDTAEPTSAHTYETEAPDPNRLTFFKFTNRTRTITNNDPATIQYSANGNDWVSSGAATEDNYGYLKMSNRNAIEQMQVTYTYDTFLEEARDALNNAKSEGGTGKVKFKVTLESCYDEMGNEMIAEVSFQLTFKPGIESEAPQTISFMSWQYPQTTRTYYVDVTRINHYSQLNTVDIKIQNYWYVKNNQLVDYDAEYRAEHPGEIPDEMAAMAAGYRKCRIRPTAIVSPMTVVTDSKENCNNTAYDVILDNFNSNGGKVPQNVQDRIKVDPKADGNISTDPDVPTKPTAVVKPATPSLTSAKLTKKNSVTLNWKAAKNATNYQIYRAENSTAASKYKLIKTTGKVLKFIDNTVKAGKKYYYKINAVNNTSSGKAVSGFSVVKGIKVLNYNGQAKIKATSKSKAKATVKISKKITNASTYQVQYSTNKKFKSAKAKTGKTKINLSKLSSKKVYYVRARAYTKINGKTYYSKWSKAAKVKIK